MMDPPFVSITRHGGICTVELVNSKSMNILGSAATKEMTTTFVDLGQDNDPRAVVSRGAGDKAFIGDADITEMDRRYRQGSARNPCPPAYSGNRAGAQPSNNASSTL